LSVVGVINLIRSILFSFVLRNKILLSSFSFFFAVLAFFYSLSLKRIWEGQFQIVLNSEENKNINLAPNPMIQNLLKGTDKNDLNTQVGILKSPSVLMPIFNFVNNQYIKDNPEKKLLKYKNWEKQLFIDLQRNTSILNISYEDKNKKIIVPVLKKISETYQDYSGRSKARNIKLTKNYLKNQIDIFKNRSIDSIRAAQEFGIEQDLIVPNISGIISFEPSSIDRRSLSNIRNIEIEQIRVEAANEIRRIDIQISQIENLDDPKQVQYIAATIPTLVEEGLPVDLKNLEQELIEKSVIYKKNDKVIQNIIQKKDLLIDLFKERSIGFLKARKEILKAKMQAAIRPKGVLLKYKELIRDATRDEETLINLENQFNKIKLEEAKLNDPWQLITKPTLIDEPVTISKKKVVFISSIFGIILGFIYSFFKEKKSGIIFDEYEYERIFNAPIIQSSFKGEIRNLFFIENLINIGKNDIYIFPLETVDLDEVESLKKNILNINNNINVYIERQMKNIKQSNMIILFASLNKINISDAIEISKIKEKYNINFSGIILIN